MELAKQVSFHEPPVGVMKGNPYNFKVSKRKRHLTVEQQQFTTPRSLVRDSDLNDQGPAVASPPPIQGCPASL